MNDKKGDQEELVDYEDVGMFNALILTLINSDVRKLTWLMIGVFFIVQLVLRDFRIWYYGASFIHWTDWVLTGTLAYGYYYYSKLIAELYLQDFYEELKEIHEPEVEQAPAIPSDSTFKLETCEIEKEVIALYVNSGEKPEVMLASMAKVIGNVMLVTKHNTVEVDFPDMKVHVTVEDLEEK